jgi:F0F1-type ATP synthase membrane subunit b/b'
MVDTIESFVSKLQEQGVQTGREAAQKLQDEAKLKAQQIIADAEAKGQQIIADAEKQGESILSRSQTELDLAARDTTAKLRDTLSASLNELLAKAANVTLSDTNVLGTILHDIVVMYVEADIKHQELVKINVSHDIRQKLVDWAIKELGRGAVDNKRSHIELKGNLKQAGFEYSVHNGTIEVTPESVVSTLSDIVTPALRDILAGVSEESQEQ